MEVGGRKLKSVEQWLGTRAADGESPGRLAPGTSVGDWRVVAFIGAGLSAEVYRVRNVRYGHDGALKLLVDGSRGLRERFLAEADALRFLALTAGQVGWVSTGNKEAMIFSITSDGCFGGYVGDNYTAENNFGIPADKMRHLWKFSSGEQIISSGSRLNVDRLVGTATIGDTAKAGQTMYLGTRHQGWGGVGTKMNMRSYGFKAYTDGTLTTDLVPAIVRGKPCLYDMVAQKAYYSLDTLYSLGWNAQIDKDRYGLAISVK